jgi:hypothetical protein
MNRPLHQPGRYISRTSLMEVGLLPNSYCSAANPVNPRTEQCNSSHKAGALWI